MGRKRKNLIELLPETKEVVNAVIPTKKETTESSEVSSIETIQGTILYHPIKIVLRKNESKFQQQYKDLTENSWILIQIKGNAYHFRRV